MIVRVHHYLTPRRVLYIALVLLLLMIVGRIVTQSVWASSSESRSGQHVLRIYDGGMERGILTDADTLREALESAGIALDKNDITEPSLDSKLEAAAYDVNIYRARPVMVVDGSKVTKVITPYRTAKQIAKQADIELQSEDNVRVEHGADVVLEGALERMVIDRAHEVKTVLYGEELTFYTHLATVKELLADKDITVKDEDTLSVTLDAPIVDGMTIELWRNGEQTIEEEVTIEHPVQEIQDSNHKVGYREVQTPGKDGKRLVTYEVVMKNGQEVSRKEIASKTLEETAKEVVVIGTKNNYSGTLNEWLLALRTCETHGNYQANTGNGFYGAYQFMPATWNSIARLTGRTDLVGVSPHLAAPADQDAMVIANANATAGLRTQHPGCYVKLGLSNKPPQ